MDWSSLQGSGRTGRIVERDIRQAARSLPPVLRPPAPVSTEVNASPLARRLAEAVGLDLAQLATQHPGKRLERADVEAALRIAIKDGAIFPSPPGRGARREGISSPLGRAPVEPTEAEGVEFPSPSIGRGARGEGISPVRRLTADRLALSAHTTAPVTLTTETDATELVRLRRQLKEDNAERVPSFTDLLICAATRALVEHPRLNAHLDGDTIVQSGAVNLGFAVDTERGLLVPVIKDAPSKTLLRIAEETEALIEKAQRGRFQPEEMQGGTFTITNLGMYEIDAFTPIINLPECAILGVGRIVPKQVVVDADLEKVAIRHMLVLSLTFDHRLVDGAPAARFLQRIKRLVEQPYLWLVS